MQAKVLYGGEGAKVPFTDFGMSFSLFKLWLRPTGAEWTGYTTASLQGLLGIAILETPIVEVTTRDLEDEEAFFSLHGTTLDITLTPNTFVKDGGLVTVNLKILNNDSLPSKEITFYSDECKGFSASATNIHFTSTLLVLPSEESDPNNYTYLPW